MHVLDILSESKVDSDKYVPAINTILSKKGSNLPLEKSPGVYINFYPTAGQQITSLQDPIKGKLDDGTVIEKLAKHVYKSDAIKNLFSGKAAGSNTANKGELAEGYHSVAVFARLIHRPLKDIDVNDITEIIDRLENGVPLVLDKVKETTSKIADKFELRIRLKPQAWKEFKEPDTIKFMGKLIDSIIADANHESSKYAHRFATNQAFDFARVVGDGVSDESERKTDVSFENHREKKFAGFSLKIDTTKQVHQVGGGAVQDSKTGKKASPEERFQILANNLFAVDGRFPLADISSTQDDFLKATDIVKMQQIAYRAATDSFNQNFASDNNEKEFIRNLIGAMKYWMGRDDPNIKVKQFTNSGTYILNPSKVDTLIDRNDIQLEATYTDATKDNLPKLTIRDSISGKPLVTFRTYKNGKGYVRNYIEKELLWVELTLIKHIPNKPGKQVAQKQEPVKPETSKQLAPNMSMAAPRYNLKTNKMTKKEPDRGMSPSLEIPNMGNYALDLDSNLSLAEAVTLSRGL